MSIRCNLGAPKEVPSEVMDRLLATDLDIVDLERRSTYKSSADNLLSPTKGRAP
jgi:hypothetical protein